MLFIKSKTTERKIDGSKRIPLLETLEDRGFTPIVRRMRLAAFEQTLLSPERVKELERIMSAGRGVESDAPFVRGDIFCFETYVLFLIFGEEHDDFGARAGIVHTSETNAPGRALEIFCNNIEDIARAGAQGEASGDGATTAGFVWSEREGGASESFQRFAAETENGGSARLSTSSQGETSERIRAVEALEDAEARRLLRRLSDAQSEGRTSEMLYGASREVETTQDALIGRLAGAGLVRRELLISCRKDGRSLFRLPSADALAVITESNAVCSECGASVADERAEELISPTTLAATMLADGAWLTSRVRAMLSSLGVADSQIATRGASGDSDALLMAAHAGEPFLFVLRDGEFTLAHARRAVDAEIDVEASHLVLIATGRIHEDARARMREHQKRRARTGSELNLILAESVDAAATEIRSAVERVTEHALASDLYELDSALGMNAGRLIAARFRLTEKSVGLQDLAASAAATLAGSLNEF